jgi:signal transduction histidine kinase
MQMQPQVEQYVQLEPGSKPVTRFAPPERVSPSEVEAAALQLSNDSLLKALLDATGMFVMVLNKYRQIVVASNELAHQLDLSTIESLIGFRPGEAFNCVHAWENPAGCGASEACSTCGAVLAILQSQQSGLPHERECLMRVRRGEIEEALEFRVKTSQVKILGESYTLIALTDISKDKRREVLENLFFHDILNTLSGLRGWSSVLDQASPEKRETASKRIRFLTERLCREIEDQRALIMAESGVLQTQMAPVAPYTILDAVDGIFAGHDAARNKSLETVRAGADTTIVTDESLVIRVLANMVKNALESTPANGVVRVQVSADERNCEFSVWNAGGIPKPIALQIFRRSFSTKATKGRGLGTFSMKLFGERYLGGKVRFRTSEAEGTVFSLTIPTGRPPAKPTS